MAKKIRVLIADDHAVVRQGLRTMLAPKDTFELVGEAANGAELVQLCRQLQPDLVILDLIMPEMDGIEAIRQIRAQGIKTKMLVLSSFSEENKVIAALKAGANSYILKESSPEDLMRAIQATMQGEMWVYPNLALKALGQLIHPADDSAAENEFTRKELQVIKLIARGKTNLQIAQDLNVNESTVRFHLSNIFSKLGLKNRTQVALYALREGLATLEE
jgi:NarL family two-component system response regulator LiaR